MTTEKALMADAAADCVGVNTHINYGGSIYDTRYGDIIKPRLIELGARHIRDSPGGPTDTKVKGRYTEMAAAGVRTLLINWDATHKDYAKGLNAGGQVVVEAAEPPNERDNSGSGWQTVLRDFMLRMYPAYKNDSATAAMPILGPSFANTRDAPGQFASTMSNAGTCIDVGNVHDYSGTFPESPQGGGWGISMADALQRYRVLSGTDPIWSTENGYKMSGGVSGHPAVPQRAAAKYMLRQFLAHLQAGVGRFYIYQLINDAEDFGLLNNDGSTRQQFVAVKNFVATFKDPGPAFATSSLDYTLAGDLTNVRHMLFQKRDGRFYLVFWQAVASCSSETVNTEPPARNVTLTLATAIARGNLLQPSFSMTATAVAANSEGRVNSVALAVPDHALVIELIPATAVTEPPPVIEPPPVVTPPPVVEPPLAGIDVQGPTPPRGLKATYVGKNSVNLGWTSSTDDTGVVAYDVFRNGVRLATLAPDVAVYSVTGLASLTTYTFQVLARDAMNNPSLSPEITVKTH